MLYYICPMFLPQVRKLIGFSLLPQVGAALAFALIIQHEFGTGLLTEFIGPYLTKNSLFKGRRGRIIKNTIKTGISLVVVVLFDDSYFDDILLGLTSISGGRVTIVDGLSGTENLS